MGSQYSIAPGPIASPDITGGPGIVLADPQWPEVQQYAVDGKALPTDEQSFRTSLGAGAPADLSDFKQLIDVYAHISTHCHTWDGVFKGIVTLADHVWDYGANKAPTYYPPILPLAHTLETEPGNTQAQERLKAILAVLKQEATAYATEASSVFSQIKQFADDTSADRLTLVGPDGKSGLLEYYNDKYASTSKAVEEIVQKTEAARGVLNEKEAEYRHDVIVASTTPTYAWIWPFGTVAGAVVAGIYGKKATEVLREEGVIKKEIEDLDAEKAADAKLIRAIGCATDSVTSIANAMTDALGVIGKVESAWSALASDLGSIVKTIETNIAEVPPIIMNLGVETALTEWHNVALAADTYRQKAYISVSPTAIETWRLETYVLGETPSSIVAAAA
jgi:hypothetical protein